MSEEEKVQLIKSILDGTFKFNIPDYNIERYEKPTEEEIEKLIEDILNMRS